MERESNSDMKHKTSFYGTPNYYCLLLVYYCVLRCYCVLLRFELRVATCYYVLTTVYCLLHLLLLVTTLVSETLGKLEKVR